MFPVAVESVGEVEAGPGCGFPFVRTKKRGKVKHRKLQKARR